MADVQYYNFKLCYFQCFNSCHRFDLSNDSGVSEMNNKDKIIEARKIQKMIVDGGDSNEINARVWCLKYNYGFVSISKYGAITAENLNVNYGFPDIRDGISATKYTTSLDVCQSIMLDGWCVNDITRADGKFTTALTCLDRKAYEFSPPLPTMAEAWLYAILESYIYEWSRDYETE